MGSGKKLKERRSTAGTPSTPLADLANVDLTYGDGEGDQVSLPQHLQARLDSLPKPPTGTHHQEIATI